METTLLLAALREKANLSQPKLAQLLGTSLVSVTRWERGMGNPSPEQANRIADLYAKLVKGLEPGISKFDPFGSRGIRTRVPGQGVLGESLAIISLGRSTQPPILSRLMSDDVFKEGGEQSLFKLFQSHSNSAETVRVPFNNSVSAGKNTYTYDAHTYHTKVPPQGISELLSYYLPYQGLVLDPFAGSGMTGVAASVRGVDCILTDLSPAACFISDRFTTSVSPREFEAAV